MNFRVVSALLLRYVFLYTRTWIRMIELVFWPTVELMVWGFLGGFLYQNAGDEIGYIVGWLIGGMILWDVLFRAQQGVAISFLEDVWTNNLLNVFVAPIRQREYLAATFGVGLLRICITVTVISVLAAVAYRFNVFVLDWYLLPFFANLMVFGWALGMISTALILRWGQAAEALAWAVPFFIQPIACVFYPVAQLPGWLQVTAKALPCSYIFEGMRAVIRDGAFDATALLGATALNFLYLAMAGLVYLGVLRSVIKKGLLTKVVTH